VARPRPPPLPRAPPAPWPARGEARAGFAAAAEALREPVARAADAVSILRLAAPALGHRAAEALTAAEAALQIADRRVGALAAAGEGGVRRAVDLGALVEDLVARFPFPPGVRVRTAARPSSARALADDRPVRAALREVLAAAAAATASGGELQVAALAGPAAVSIEIRSPTRVPAGGLSLARALVAPQGGRVEEVPDPGHGAGGMVRIALERAPSLEPA
jgi:signal transduction histidine kinase